MLRVLLEHGLSIFDVMFYWRFFITGAESSCFMGIALGIVKKVDSVVVLEGGVPLIWRPHAETPDQSAQDVREWGFVA